MEPGKRIESDQSVEITNLYHLNGSILGDKHTHTSMPS